MRCGGRKQDPPAVQVQLYPAYQSIAAACIASILKRKGNFNHRQIDPVENLVRLCEVSHLNSNLRSQSLLRAVRLL